MVKTILLILSIILPLVNLVAQETRDAGKPSNPEERRLIETSSPFLVKVIAEQPMLNKRYVVTGFAIDEDSVLTSALISPFGDERIRVLTVAGDIFETELLGHDPSSSLALLKVKGTMAFAKKTASVKIGDSVWVMGAFYHSFPSLFRGVVSSVNDQQMIINAPAIPGVSGAAVITTQGALAGIVRGRLGVAWNRDLRIRSDETELLLPGEKQVGQPLLFAMPIKSAKRIASDLNEFGYLRVGWVGVWCQQNEKSEIEVSEITQASPAERAGIKPGDILLTFDKQPLETITDLQSLIFGKRPGDILTLRIKRGMTIQEIKVKAGENPQKEGLALNRSFTRPQGVHSEAWFFNSSSEPSLRMMRMGPKANMGLTGTLIGKESALRMGIKEGHGILLSNVMMESPFGTINLKAGDVVVEVDGQPIRSLEDLEKIAQKMETLRFGDNPEHKTMLKYYRNSKPQSVAIQFNPEPLKADEIRQLRNRMEQVSSMLRDQEFQALSDNLQRLKNRINQEKGFSGAEELQKIEKRINDYRKKALERIESEYKILRETINQLKKEIGAD